MFEFLGWDFWLGLAAINVVAFLVLAFLANKYTPKE
jgi:hypothetical protein